ncbi:MAG: hypothetical protein MZV65_32635 [Chromatiales bacterium]|nr:hypothetical protein [Chromatiales bacterium]
MRMTANRLLAISRIYLTKIFVLVIPTKLSSLSRLSNQLRYENILIIDLPTQINADVLPIWIQNQKTGLKTALLCSKQQLANLARYLPSPSHLKKLSRKLEKTTQIKTEVLPSLNLGDSANKVLGQPAVTKGG